jgi:hypothetical protein
MLIELHDGLVVADGTYVKLMYESVPTALITSINWGELVMQNARLPKASVASQLPLRVALLATARSWQPMRWLLSRLLRPEPIAPFALTSVELMATCTSDLTFSPATADAEKPANAHRASKAKAFVFIPISILIRFL